MTENPCKNRSVSGEFTNRSRSKSEGRLSFQGEKENPAPDLVFDLFRGLPKPYI